MQYLKLKISSDLRTYGMEEMNNLLGHWFYNLKNNIVNNEVLMITVPTKNLLIKFSEFLVEMLSEFTSKEVNKYEKEKDIVLVLLTDNKCSQYTSVFKLIEEKINIICLVLETENYLNLVQHTDKKILLMEIFFKIGLILIYLRLT